MLLKFEACSNCNDGNEEILLMKYKDKLANATFLTAGISCVS